MSFIRQLSIRVDEKLSSALEERAEGNKRSLNAEIITILENAVLNKEADNKKIAVALRSIADEIEFSNFFEAK